MLPQPELRVRALALLTFLVSAHAQFIVERWAVFEFAQTGPADAPPSFNPFTDVAASVTFTHTTSGESVVVPSFFDGGTAYLTRFAPARLGAYTLVTASSSPLMPPRRGTLTATAPSANNHGYVARAGPGSRAFAFADGTAHVSVGSTSYAWIHVSDASANATLETLRRGPFNKLRMTIFPKFYPWTHIEPPDFAFARAVAPPAPCTICCPSQNGSFDLTRFDPAFWRKLDGYVRAMQAMGVIADLILFHPYDGGHWGFDGMGMLTDQFYLRYAAARLGAFSNVWWSMANEWSDLKHKCDGHNSSACPQDYFDELFVGLTAADVHQRQRSIHNGPIYYNHSRPWIDHISMQCSGELTDPHSRAAGSTCVDMAKSTWLAKPIIMDEVRYEGNISAQWGNLTAESMAQRFWLFLSKGAFCGHSETIQPEVWDAA